MRKFDNPFDSYKVGDINPIDISLHRNSIERFRDLYDNPLYYYYGFQYTSGSLYRAILGYETVWDLEAEASLVQHLDDYLYQARLERFYYFEDYITTRNVQVLGIKWIDGVKPKQLRFHGRAMNGFAEIPPGTKLLFRVNKLDSPHHADVEFEDGKVISIPFKRYESLREDAMKRYETKPTQSLKRSTVTKNGSARKPDETKNAVGRVIPPEVAIQLLSMRKRFRRTNAL